MITPKHIADALLVHTCHDLCAVVCLSDDGQLLSVALFDPEYYGVQQAFSSRVSEIWLIANHECGNMEPKERELRHLRTMMCRAPGRVVRFFLSSEYWECREICLAQRDGM